MTVGRKRDQLKCIRVQLFKVLTEVVEENPVDGCCGDNKHLESILREGPEKVLCKTHIQPHLKTVSLILFNFIK